MSVLLADSQLCSIAGQGSIEVTGIAQLYTAHVCIRSTDYIVSPSSMSILSVSGKVYFVFRLVEWPPSSTMIHDPRPWALSLLEEAGIAPSIMHVSYKSTPGVMELRYPRYGAPAAPLTI